jgi:hypothetical protein
VQQTLAGTNPGIVIAMDDLAEQDVLGIRLCAGGPEVAPEGRRQLVRYVQPPSVYAHLPKPELGYLEEVVFDLLVFDIQFRQLLMALPGPVGKGVVVRAVTLRDEVPILILTFSPLCASLDQRLERKEVPPCVVKDT